MAAPDNTELAGKVVLVTGGTAGLGKATVGALAAKRPMTIIITGRNAERAEAVKSEIKSQYPQVNLEFIPCDLASFASIRTASKQIATLTDDLSILICNAGIMAVPPATTVDGYELQFGTNYLGHALLTKELMPLLQRAKSIHHDSRVVSLTSNGFALASTIDFSTLKTPQASLGIPLGFGSKWIRYGQSKLAQQLYTQRLATEMPDITFVSVHPGIINTDLVNTLGWLDRFIVFLGSKFVEPSVTPDEGVRNTVWAATAPKADVTNGGFFEPVGRVGQTTAASTDGELRDRLWEWTREQIA